MVQFSSPLDELGTVDRLERIRKEGIGGTERWTAGLGESGKEEDSRRAVAMNSGVSQVARRSRMRNSRTFLR